MNTVIVAKPTSVFSVAGIFNILQNLPFNLPQPLGLEANPRGEPRVVWRKWWHKLPRP